MKPFIFAILLLVYLLSSGCVPSQSFDTHLHSIVKPFLFSIARWELKAIPNEVNQWIFSSQKKIDDGVQLVTEYFSATERINILNSVISTANTDNGKHDMASLQAELNRLREQNKAIESMVESIIEKQIRDTLTQQGIFNPLIESKVNFPPVDFKLAKPPYLLVISPRDRIEAIREITLQPDIKLGEIEDIETMVDRLDVSSLVVELGGLGVTYPTLVNNDASLQFVIDTTTEEWLHQYLAFKPLGFLYVLDLTNLSRNYEIVTMNETLASMVSKEIGAIVYGKYYSEYGNGTNQNKASEAGFDFNQEMREIRKAVDIYLAQGQIEQAEEFMEQKRQYLASKGYYIRKLNQAYFAFHGTYADSLTSVSPIGIELKKLKAQTTSLKDFLSTAADMTSRQDLINSIK
ncbi:hypothetical protein ACFLVH_03045 [Chloroflexota bacterium]